MKRVLTFLILLNSFNFWGQQEVTLTVAVDSTAIKIGEQLNYFLQVKADSSAQVVFPEEPLFAPFELLEASPIDTIRSKSHYLYTKKYALIQFDSETGSTIIACGHCLWSSKLYFELHQVA